MPPSEEIPGNNTQNESPIPTKTLAASTAQPENDDELLTQDYDEVMPDNDDDDDDDDDEQEVVLPTSTSVAASYSSAGTNKQDRLCKVILHKATNDSKLGISFSGDGTPSMPVLIKDIRPGSVAATCPKRRWLQPGLAVVRIQHVSLQGRTGWAAAKMLTACPAGPVVLHVTGLTTTVPRPTNLWQSRRQRLGLGLSVVQEGRMVVTRVDKLGPWQGTNLTVGREVLSIHGVRCPATTEAATTLLLSQPRMRLVTRAGVRRPNSNDSMSQPELECDDGDVIVVAKATKTERNQMVGIVLKQQEGVVVVSRLEPGSLLEHSGLKAGDRILSINKRRSMDRAEAIQLIKETEGKLRIEAIPMGQYVEEEEEEEEKEDVSPQVSKKESNGTAPRSTEENRQEAAPHKLAEDTDPPPTKPPKRDSSIGDLNGSSVFDWVEVSNPSTELTVPPS